MILNSYLKNIDGPTLDEHAVAKIYKDEDETSRNHLSHSLYLEIEKVSPT